MNFWSLSNIEFPFFLKPPHFTPPWYPACRKNVETFAKYAVDANLFRLGSTDPKKISRPWMLFGEGLSPPSKKVFILKKKSKTFQYLNKKKLAIFYSKCSNLHEISGIGWIERKIRFQIFTTIIFRVMVIFIIKTVNFWWIFTITRKIKELNFLFDSVHCASFMKMGAKLRGRRGVVCEICFKIWAKNKFRNRTSFRNVNQ